MKKVIALLSKYADMPIELKNELYEMTTRVEVRKFKTIHNRNEVCDKLYFIEEGLVCCYNQIDGETKEYCTWAYKEMDIITSVDSFETGQKSADRIIALKHCILWSITKQQFEYLTDKYKAFADIRRKLYEKYHRHTRDMEAMRQRDPEVFYNYLKTHQDYAYLLKLPKKHLAALFGISKSTFFNKVQGGTQSKK